MRGRTVVVTGASSGIGLAGAEALARTGARLVLCGRDAGRLEDALVRVRRAGPGTDHAVHLADLSLAAEARRLGEAIAAAEGRVDVLVNNAGALFSEAGVTAEGVERTFALNHLAPFVLTAALRPALVAAGRARVVTTSSVGHRYGRLDLDALGTTRNYSGWAAYCTSKLCNILFTRELARRLEGTGVTATCFHPGFVASRFGDDSGGAFRPLFGLAKHLLAISPERGAETLVYLAASPEVEGRSGGYYAKRRPAEPSRAARDDGAARRLWEKTETLAASPATAPGSGAH